jgi:hypothetical protein
MRGAHCAPLIESFAGSGASVPTVSRPARFEDHRYLGDKRTQVVYDLDHVDEAGLADTIAELMASERFAAFGPDTLAEARNRGYRLHHAQRELLADD